MTPQETPRTVSYTKEGYPALPAEQSTLEGKPCLTSFWRPTPEEIARIQAGDVIFISLLGSWIHPPICVGLKEFPRE